MPTVRTRPRPAARAVPKPLRPDEASQVLHDLLGWRHVAGPGREAACSWLASFVAPAREAMPDGPRSRTIRADEASAAIGPSGRRRGRGPGPGPVGAPPPTSPVASRPVPHAGRT